MLFSRVKISCFRAKAHLVFHWYLYNKFYYRISKACCIKILKSIKCLANVQELQQKSHIIVGLVYNSLP